MQQPFTQRYCDQVDVNNVACGRPVHTKGVCGLHAARLRAGMDMSMPIHKSAKPVTTCVKPICGYPAYAHGLCNAHYQRVIHGRESDKPVVRNGVPLVIRVPEWLQECTRVGDCLVFPRVNKTGYATHVHDDYGIPISRHRAVYKGIHGEIPKWAQIHHTCGVNTCINPEHLVLASQKENVGEMLARREYEARIAHLESELVDMADRHCEGCNCPK